MQRRFTYRLDPTPSQARHFAQTAGACRWVFNGALAIREALYRDTGKAPGLSALCKWLTWQRASVPWLREIAAVTQQQAIRDLLAAYTRFFSGQNRRPRFKSRRRSRASFRVPGNQGVRFGRLSGSVGRVKLPKVGWVRLRWSRELPGSIVSATVYRRAGHWYVSLLTKQPAVTVEPKTEGTRLGLDLGVARTVTASDGRVFQAPTPDHAKQRTLQRQLSRKVKGSRNWYKALMRLQRHKATEADRLNDFHHQTSTQLVRESQTLVLERLVVTHMTKKTRGRGRAQKARLNRSILAQGWHIFRRMIEQKGAAAGVDVVAVDPAFTSQTCAKCGVVAKASRKNQSVFDCISCGHTDNADVNAARNILQAAGHVVFTCGGTVRPPEPVTAPGRVPLKQAPIGEQLTLFG